ncbi:cold shock and DUF1294 domain-containing protein [Lacisediminihabitans sp.]|jgi:uncharacterized membrane protein YsdA (DUF1294 family)/cold shock CspA family protein|uniref:cold shock and DUF1294 domain-containing protein n=1 Tax=Lacisediminihabitans sp. TaxID=2787631 RepID=UPI002F934723
MAIAREPVAGRLEGTLTTWNDQRGFGFITPSGGGRTVFVHISAFAPRDTRPLTGELLTFERDAAPEGREQATHVKAVAVPAPKTTLPTNRAPTGRTAMPRTAKPRHKPAPPNQSPVSYLAILAFIALYVFVSVAWTVPYWPIALYLVMSVLSFFAYASDKAAATAGRWRTSESTLLVLGLLGGWPGSIFAQQRLRHKTRKATFQLAFWGTVLLNIAAFVTIASPSVAALIAHLG